MSCNGDFILYYKLQVSNNFNLSARRVFISVIGDRLNFFCISAIIVSDPSATSTSVSFIWLKKTWTSSCSKSTLILPIFDVIQRTNVEYCSTWINKICDFVSTFTIYLTTHTPQFASSFLVSPFFFFFLIKALLVFMIACIVETINTHKHSVC